MGSEVPVSKKKRTYSLSDEAAEQLTKLAESNGRSLSGALETLLLKLGKPDPIIHCL